MKQPDERTLQQIVLTICYAQLIIEHIDNLQAYTPFFRNKIKMVAKNLQKLLEQKIDRLVKDKEDAPAADQLVNVSDMCNKMLLCLLNVDDKHYVGFTNDFKRMLEKYHLDKDLIKEVFEL